MRMQQALQAALGIGCWRLTEGNRWFLRAAIARRAELADLHVARVTLCDLWTDHRRFSGDVAPRFTRAPRSSEPRRADVSDGATATRYHAAAPGETLTSGPPSNHGAGHARVFGALRAALERRCGNCDQAHCCHSRCAVGTAPSSRGQPQQTGPRTACSSLQISVSLVHLTAVSYVARCSCLWRGGLRVELRGDAPTADIYVVGHPGDVALVGQRRSSAARGWFTSAAAPLPRRR